MLLKLVADPPPAIPLTSETDVSNQVGKKLCRPHQSISSGHPAKYSDSAFELGAHRRYGLAEPIPIVTFLMVIPNVREPSQFVEDPVR
jgi:hypothetical protein